MERIYTLDLRDVYKKPVTKRIRVAAAVVRKAAARHAGMPADMVNLSSSVNDLLFSKGRMKIPRRIKIKLTIDEKGAVVSLPEERPEEKAAPKEAAKPILEERKEKKPEEEKQERPKFEQKTMEAAGVK